jgi:hypothetical protein
MEGRSHQRPIRHFVMVITGIVSSVTGITALQEIIVNLSDG